MNVQSPNFFIVGAPRSGTTAMYEYLRQHPEIYMPDFKEPHFFLTDLDIPRIKDKNQYLAFFKKAKDRKRIGEASPFYLYSKQAALNVKNFCPNAFIIIMLRNPVDMIYSLHAKYLINGIENIKSFSEAWNMEAERKKGVSKPTGPFPLELLYYREIGRYSQQVKRYFDVFGKERVFVIIFDDFKSDTAKTFKETLKFLEVNENFKLPFFKITNATETFRSEFLHRVFFKFPKYAKWHGARGIPFFGNIIRKFKNLLMKPQKLPPMDPYIRKQLSADFVSDVDELSILLGRNLSSWFIS